MMMLSAKKQPVTAPPPPPPAYSSGRCSSMSVSCVTTADRRHPRNQQQPPSQPLCNLRVGGRGIVLYVRDSSKASSSLADSSRSGSDDSSGPPPVLYDSAVGHLALRSSSEGRWPSDQSHHQQQQQCVEQRHREPEPDYDISEDDNGSEEEQDHYYNGHLRHLSNSSYAPNLATASRQLLSQFSAGHRHQLQLQQSAHHYHQQQQQQRAASSLGVLTIRSNRSSGTAVPQRPPPPPPPPPVPKRSPNTKPTVVRQKHHVKFADVTRCNQASDPIRDTGDLVNGGPSGASNCNSSGNGSGLNASNATKLKLNESQLAKSVSTSGTVGRSKSTVAAKNSITNDLNSSTFFNGQKTTNQITTKRQYLNCDADQTNNIIRIDIQAPTTTTAAANLSTANPSTNTYEGIYHDAYDWFAASQFGGDGEHIYERVGEDTEREIEEVNQQQLKQASEKKSFSSFASKEEILDYLQDAKQRVQILINSNTSLAERQLQSKMPELSARMHQHQLHLQHPYPHPAANQHRDDSGNGSLSNQVVVGKEAPSHRRYRTSNVSNTSSTDSAVTTGSSFEADSSGDSQPATATLPSLPTSAGGSGKATIGTSVSLTHLVAVERNDSGICADGTCKPSILRRTASLSDAEPRLLCECDNPLLADPSTDVDLLYSGASLLTCQACEKKRIERKEVIQEIVSTEIKYGRDLHIIREEFMRPMETAGLLNKDQLKNIFINIEDLIAVNSKFSAVLQESIDEALKQRDEDFVTVQIGRLFLESSAMLSAFEVYCIRQGQASLLLTQLEKEKELLRIFLRVSQIENTLLRRMNLSAFLMVPVQRVTKYPLLLERLFRVTPLHHPDRDVLKSAQLKVEMHLEHINQQSKSRATKLWRRISNLSVARKGNEFDHIKLQQAALDALRWPDQEVTFVLCGRLQYLQLDNYNSTLKTIRTYKRGRTLKFLNACALLMALGKPNEQYRPDQVRQDLATKHLHLPKGPGCFTDVALVLMKEKGNRFVLCREPFLLQRCVVSSDPDLPEIVELTEHYSKESFHIKAETFEDTRTWFGQLSYHCKDLGNWRRRRNGLANIMMLGHQQQLLQHQLSDDG